MQEAVKLLTFLDLMVIPCVPRSVKENAAVQLQEEMHKQKASLQEVEWSIGKNYRSKYNRQWNAISWSGQSLKPLQINPEVLLPITDSTVTQLWTQQGWRKEKKSILTELHKIPEICHRTPVLWKTFRVFIDWQPINFFFSFSHRHRALILPGNQLKALTKNKQISLSISLKKIFLFHSMLINITEPIFSYQD